MDITILKQIIELGWPAIVTVGFFLLARQYLAQVQGEIAYLRKRVDDLESRTDKVEKENAANYGPGVPGL